MQKNIYLSLFFSSLLFSQSIANGTDEKSKVHKKPNQSILLDEIIVTPTRSGVNLNKYAGSVGVIEDNALKKYSNVIDSIKFIPGVDTTYSMGREIGNNFSIRGFGYQNENRVIIMQDGISRDPGLFSSMISNFRTDSDILKRVEVVKGASSILHGSGAIGGIVAMTTKDARDYLNPDEYFGAMLGTRIESNNMRSGRVAVYAKGKETPYDILLYAKKAKFGDINLAKGGTVDKTYDDEKVTTMFFKGGFDIGDSHRAQLSYYDYKNSLNTMWQTLWQNDENLFVNGDLKQKDFSFDYTYKPLNDLIDFDLKIYKSKASYRRGYDIINRGQRAMLDYENKDERRGINLKNISKFDLFGTKNSLVFGVDYLDRKDDASWIQNGEAKDNFSWMPAKYKDLGIYIHNIMSFDKFELTLGGRFDKFDRKGRNNDYDDSRFSPRIALSYELFENLNLLAGYAETFRAPTPHETAMAGPINRMYWYEPNSDLKAEIAKEYEIGLSYDREFDNGDTVNFKGMYFNGKIKDMINVVTIREDEVPPGGFSQHYGQYKNVDSAKREGFEISANYTNSYFGIKSSYEHIKLTDSKTGKKIKNFADKLMVGVDAYFPNNITLGFDVSHYFKPDLEEKSYKNRFGTYYYSDKSFTIVNFKGNIEFENFLSGASLNFGINNIFDDKYINANVSAKDEEFRFVGKGRNAYLDLEIKF